MNQIDKTKFTPCNKFLMIGSWESVFLSLFYSKITMTFVVKRIF